MDNQVPNATKKKSKSRHRKERRLATTQSRNARRSQTTSKTSSSPPLSHNTVHPGSLPSNSEYAASGPAQNPVTAAQELGHTPEGNFSSLAANQAHNAGGQEQHSHTCQAASTSRLADQILSVIEGSMLEVYAADTQYNSDTCFLSRIGQDLNAFFSYIRVGEDDNDEGGSPEGKLLEEDGSSCH